MQPPQRERRVAHPAVAVVPVALAARRLRQRGRQRRDHRAGRRVGEALQHERRALQVLAPRVVGIGAGGQPLAPVVARSARCARAPARACAGRRAARSTTARRSAARPRASCGARARCGPRCPSACRCSSRTVVVAVGGVEREVGRRRRRGVQRAGVAAVVEARRADQLDRHLALHALDRAHEQVVGVVVGRRARVRAADGSLPCQSPIVSASRTTSQPVGVIQVVSSTLVPGLVAAAGRHVDAVGGEPERAGAAVEQRAEHARRRRSAAGTATRPSRRARPARRCGSPRGTRSRRSAGTTSAAPRRRA